VLSFGKIVASFSDSPNNFMLYHPVTIGNLTIPGNLFLAPVAGYSDRAFRSVCREGGANFAYTEMVSAEALVRGSDKTHQLMVRAANEDTYAVQLFGGTPEVMAQAVEQVLTQNDKEVVPEVIDINAGCPVPKITKTGAGSSLTRCPEQLYKVVAAAVSASSSLGDKQVPVTIKIRSGWDAQNMTWKEAALAAVEAGAAALTIHPRTRAQGYEGKSDWGILAELVELIQAETQGKVPVFGSGDIFTPEDAQRMLQETGCQGVMFARGAMGNPFIFIQTRQLLETGSYEEIESSVRIKAGLHELKCLIQDAGEDSACRQMRKRFCAYSKGVPGGSRLREAIVAATTEADYISLFQREGLV
jgi:nifR3 family TIM-barrel protein